MIDKIRSQAADGSEVIRYRARIRVAGGRKKPIGTYDTEAEARADLALAKNLAEEPEVETVASWGETWLTKKGRDNSLVCRFRNHILADPIAKRPLVMLSKADVRGFYTRLQKRDNRAGTLRNTIKTFVGMLDAAVSEDKLSTNPAAALSKEIRRELTERAARERVKHGKGWTSLSVDEIKAVHACMKIPERGRLQIIIIALQGWRRGEGFALRLTDLHLDKTFEPFAKLGIKLDGGSKPYADIERGSNLGPRKCREPYRSFLLGETLPFLRRWLELLSEVSHNPLGLFFPSRSGRYETHPFTQNRVVPNANGKGRGRRRWTNELREWLGFAGITRRVRLHDLRHTAATLLPSGALGGSWSLPKVQAHLGHANAASTLRYMHAETDAYAREASATGEAKLFGSTKVTQNAEKANDNEGIAGSSSHSANPRESFKKRPVLGHFLGHSGDDDGRSSAALPGLDAGELARALQADPALLAGVLAALTAKPRA